ncbi:CYTH domain-containing protein [Kordiimonas sp. SCSIO 12610]|uniref:CYTH domain-containing protein n=1 Tax=Kordiimonas sp. SCSIO 12610 TaxID=2829597 RepID=UPI00210C81B4|nr:CYTH domain-containing protein [Kordiimonas sp. SCSIO 12610]UTW56576.1 CYTH domain-containing protein [Kordiimonas sp. SCSIO 12610]
MIEIERKFLVDTSKLPKLEGGVPIAQGYLMRADDRSLRIRRKGDDYILTFKAGKGLKRTEIERPLTKDEGEHLFQHSLLDTPIIKNRFLYNHGAHQWEIDVFEGANEGLIVAEVELVAEDEAFDCPDWLGREVSSDPRFLNSNLAKHPISEWMDEYRVLLL